MTTFTVWKFDDPQGAERAEDVLKSAASDGLVTIVDHAVVVWPEGAAQPETRHAHDATKRGAGWGALWGLITGALFLVPVIGAAIGAGVGAIAKATQAAGISRDDLERIRTSVVPGTSALFLISEDADIDQLGERIRLRDATLISTNLTPSERAQLLESFGAPPVVPGME